jgi:hypothetical protein
LPVVVYRHEAWPVLLKEKLRLRASENRIWRKLFGPKRDKQTTAPEKNA